MSRKERFDHFVLDHLTDWNGPGESWIGGILECLWAACAAAVWWEGPLPKWLIVLAAVVALAVGALFVYGSYLNCEYNLGEGRYRLILLAALLFWVATAGLAIYRGIKWW